MQLFLLRETEVKTTILPKRVSGQYPIEYTAEDGQVLPLLRVTAKNDKWFISETKTIEIDGPCKVEGGTVAEFKLEEKNLYYLRKDKSELMILMVEPESLDRRLYHLFRIPAGETIDIGQADYNQIQFINPFVHEKGHVRIVYSDGFPKAIMITPPEPGKEQSYNPAYVNGRRIMSSMEAHLGDVIFLFGLHVILGPGFLAINNPDHKATVHLEHMPVQTMALREDDAEVPNQGIVFSSAPRARKEVIHKQYHIENPPSLEGGDETPWIVMLGPSITMAMGSVFSSIFTINNIVLSSGDISGALPSLVTSIIMVMGAAVWPVIGRRVQKRSQIKKELIASLDYEEYLKNVQNEIDQALRLQKSILEGNNPSLEECIQKITSVKENLWERSQRHKDFLDVMIGRGDLPLDADFSYPDRGYHSEISDSARAMYDLVAKEHVLKDVPVTVPLKGAGIVGVIGDREDVVNFGKALLIELTALHNYEDLKIIFIYNERERDQWEFVKWIPHLWNDERTFRYLANDPDEVRNISNYISALREIQKDSERGDSGPYYLIFAADKGLAERAQAIKELYHSPDMSNMTMIALYNERQYLPKACSYVIDLVHKERRTKTPDLFRNTAATLADYNDITGNHLVCHSRISYPGNPEAVFIQMSNIQLDSSTAVKQLPAQYTFMEMEGIGKPEHLDLLRRWKENSAVDSLAAPIGIDEDGYQILLDVHEKAHGPHGVIAGMTGSGKSEFIISYIAAMAINYSPEEVAFVLIDFKGGGMADIFKDLPHTAGLITNLDGNELKRSFLAIEHELEKRQKLFKEISDQKKISNIDIYKYQKLRKSDPSLKPLPHLILISDEFAELKQQYSDFMGQLIRIARIGRSLGVHLILATQKPDGVVDDQIKSNIRFKVCLKVQDKSDSQGMIGRPDATLITNAGRFYFQVGNDEVFEYGQSPWSGAVYEPTDQVLENKADYIDVLSEQGQVILRKRVPSPPRAADVPEKQIDAVIQFISNTAEQNRMHAEHLWLEPLPMPKEERKQKIHDTQIQPFVLNPIVGKYDDLVRQQHVPLTVPFTVQGHALLYGAGGSGKLEFLNTMLITLMETHGPEEVRFILCDFDEGALSAFEESPYTDLFVGNGERELLEESFAQIISELKRRREQMRKHGGDYRTYIRTSGAALPCLLLVAHNYENMMECSPDTRAGIMQLAREGMKYGIYLIVTGTTANSIPYSMQPLFRNIYTLRQNSDDQYREIVGRTEGILPEPYKGRGLVRVDEKVFEFQTQIVFEEAENKYEAILDFCNRKREAAAEVSSSGADENAKGYSSRASDISEAQKTIRGPFSREAVPIGMLVHGGGWETINLENVFLPVIYDSSHKEQKDRILDVIRQVAEQDGEYLELRAENSDASAEISRLWDEVRERASSGAECLKEGKTIPNFPHRTIAIDEPTELFDRLSEEDRVKLVAMATGVSKGYHFHSLLVSTVENAAVLTAGRFFPKSFPLTDGILLTSAPSGKMLFKNEVQFQGSAHVPNGFVVKENRTSLVEIPCK